MYVFTICAPADRDSINSTGCDPMSPLPSSVMSHALPYGQHTLSNDFKRSYGPILCPKQRAPHKGAEQIQHKDR